MKRFFALTAALAFLATPAYSQISNGAMGTADYVGPSSGTVNTPFFMFDVNVGGAHLDNWDFMCVDATRYLTTGPAFDVQFWSLSSLPTPVLDGLSYSPAGLHKAAVVYDLIKENGYEGSVGAQYASWAVNGTLGSYNPDNLNATQRDIYDKLVQAADVAANAGFAGYSFSDYYLMVEYSDPDGDGKFAYNFNNQPQITHYSVPEPGTMVLLASGLFGLVAVARRRKTAVEG